MSSFTQQLGARRRQLRAMTAAVEQQDIQIVLEAAYRIGDRRGDTAERPGRLCEAAVAHDRVNQLQRLQRQSRFGFHYSIVLNDFVNSRCLAAWSSAAR